MGKCRDGLACFVVIAARTHLKTLIIAITAEVTCFCECWGRENSLQHKTQDITKPSVNTPKLIIKKRHIIIVAACFAVLLCIFALTRDGDSKDPQTIKTEETENADNASKKSSKTEKDIKLTVESFSADFNECVDFSTFIS